MELKKPKNICVPIDDNHDLCNDNNYINKNIIRFQLRKKNSNDFKNYNLRKENFQDFVSPDELNDLFPFEITNKTVDTRDITIKKLITNLRKNKKIYKNNAKDKKIDPNKIPFNYFILNDIIHEPDFYFKNILKEFKDDCKNSPDKNECITNNLSSIFDIVCNNEPIDKLNDESGKNSEICKDVLNIATYDLIIKRPNFLSNEKFAQHPDFNKLLVDPNEDVRYNAMLNKNAEQFSNYKKLFNDTSDKIREKISSKRSSIQFKEFKNLFTDRNVNVRKNMASSIYASLQPEYKLLFDDDNIEVIQSIINNPNASNFKEFNDLLSKNKEKIMDEYRQLKKETIFEPIDRNLTQSTVQKVVNIVPLQENITLSQKDIQKVIKQIEKPETIENKGELMMNLRNQSIFSIPETINPILTKMNEISNNPSYTSEEKYIVRGIMQNPNAIQQQTITEYKKLLDVYKNDSGIRLAYSKNPNAMINTIDMLITIINDEKEKSIDEQPVIASLSKNRGKSDVYNQIFEKIRKSDYADKDFNIDNIINKFNRLNKSR